MNTYKMRKIAKLAAIGAAFTLFGTGIGYAAGEWENIWVQFDSVNLMVNGQNVTSSNLLYNDRTYVPLRACAEMLGSTVEWSQTSNTASITGGSDIDAVKMKAAATILKHFNDITELSYKLELCNRDCVYVIQMYLDNVYRKKEIHDNAVVYLNDTINSYNEFIKQLAEIENSFNLLNINFSEPSDMMEYYGLCIDSIKAAYDKIAPYVYGDDGWITDVTFDTYDILDKATEYRLSADTIKNNLINIITTN